MQSSAGEFSRLLRSYLEIVSTLVRESRQSAMAAREDWPESGFLAGKTWPLAFLQRCEALAAESRTARPMKGD